MLAIRERSVSLIAVLRATLIVVYAGVSLIHAYRYRLQISFGMLLFWYVLRQWYDKCMLGKVLAVSSLCAFVLLSALMQATTPSSIHPLGILAVFVLIYLLALGVLTFFVFWGSRLMIKVYKRAKAGTGAVLTLRRAYLYGSVLALAPVMIIGIASIGRLDFYQILLVLLFEGAACFYVARRR